MKKLGCSNRHAAELIANGGVLIDDIPVTTNEILPPLSQVAIKNKLLRKKIQFDYLAFHKPAGYISSLNSTEADSLAGFFKEYNHLAIAGRLDKASEGLLLLSNDGKWIESICNPRKMKEKEYLVWVNAVPTDEQILRLSLGGEFGKYATRNCTCERSGENVLRFILTEGKNRQIRRMCGVVGLQVIRLIRIRIGDIMLEGISPGKSRAFQILTPSMNSLKD